jgi:hypothetical protein
MTPDTMKMVYHSQDPTEKIIYSIKYEKPDQVAVFWGGVRQTSLGRFPTMNDPIGSFVQSPQDRRVYVVVGGGGGFSGNDFTFALTPLIQITMKLAVDMTEFNGANIVQYMALLLSIPPDRIRVVDVQAGSTVVKIQIVDSEVSTNATANAEASERLLLVVQTIKTAVAQGNFSYVGGYPVQSLLVEPPPVNGTYDDPIVLAEPSSSSLSTEALIGIIVGGVCGAILIATAIFCFYKHHLSTSMENRLVSVSPGLTIDSRVNKTAGPIPTAWAPSTTVVVSPTDMKKKPPKKNEIEMANISEDETINRTVGPATGQHAEELATQSAMVIASRNL